MLDFRPVHSYRFGICKCLNSVKIVVCRFLSAARHSAVPHSQVVQKVTPRKDTNLFERTQSCISPANTCAEKLGFSEKLISFVQLLLFLVWPLAVPLLSGAVEGLGCQFRLASAEKCAHLCWRKGGIQTLQKLPDYRFVWGFNFTLFWISFAIIVKRDNFIFKPK